MSFISGSGGNIAVSPPGPQPISNPGGITIQQEQLPLSIEAGVSKTLLPSGGDDSAAMVTALTSFVPFASPYVKLGVGTFNWNSSVPAFIRSMPGKVVGAGPGKTIIRLSVTAPRAFDINKIADYDTFSYIELSGFTVDVNNVSGSGDPIIFGTRKAGSNVTRVNLDRITITDVEFINAPAAAGRIGVQLSVNHLAASETQTVITNITIRGIRGTGGSGLVLIAGGGITTTGLNVYIDHIHVSDWYHSFLTPAGIPGTHIQIGSFAFGGEDIYIGPGYGENSGDDGIEINAMQHALVDGVIIKDSTNQGYRLTNFNNPTDAAAQQIEFRDSHYIKSVSTSGPGWSFPVGSTSVDTTAIVLTDCSYYRSTSDAMSASEAIAFPGIAGHGTPSLRIRNFRAVADQISISAGSVTGSFLDLNAQGPACNLDIDGFYAKASGTVTGATMAVYAVRLANATSINGRVRGIVTDYNLTGGAAHTQFGLAIGVSGGALTINTLEVSGMWLKSMVGDAAPQGVQVRGTSFVTINGPVTLTGNDWTNASANNDVGYNVDGASNVNKVRQRGNKYKTTPAPSSLTGLTTAVGSATGKPYDCLAVFTAGSGAAITAIDFSTDGGTTYTNYLTQASGVLPAGFNQALGPLDSAALLKATFTTTQPAITLVPVNP